MTRYTGALAVLGIAGAYAAGDFAFWPVLVCALAILWMWGVK